MKERIIALLLCLFLSLPLAFPAAAVQESEADYPLDGLPRLIITGGASLSRLNDDPSAQGQGHLELQDADGNTLCESDLATFHRRGATSANQQWEKKPYGFKMEKKLELIPGAGKAKKWCLITGDTYAKFNGWVNDNALLAQMFAYGLYSDIGGADPIRFRPVSLYYNGEYRGIYLLTEAVEAAKNRVWLRPTYYATEGHKVEQARIRHGNSYIHMQYYTDATLDRPTGGYLICIDPRTTDPVWFKTSHGNVYSFKAPKFPNEEQVIQIARYVQEYEDAIYADSGVNSQGRHFSEYMDMPSLIARLALDTLTAQCDIFNKSCYYSINTDIYGEFCTKLISGPALDYDGSNLAYKGIRANIMYEREYFKHGEILAMLKEFSDTTLKDRWSLYVGDDGIVSRWIEELTPAEVRNTERWNPCVTFLSGEITHRSAAKFLLDLNERFRSWYEDIWSDQNLLGATAAWDEEIGELRLTAYGTQDYSASIYEVCADGSLTPLGSGEPLSGHTYLFKVSSKRASASICGDLYFSTGSLASGYLVGAVQFSNPVLIP